MRTIGTLANERSARLFGDYLLARGIRNEVEWDRDAPGSPWTIWVASDDELDTGRTLLEQFRRQPDAPEYRRKAAEADSVKKKELAEQAAWQRRVVTGRQVFRQPFSGQAGHLAVGLVAACILVAIGSRLGENRSFLLHLFISNLPQSHGAFLAEVLRGEVWRLFTPILIHYGIAHLLFNLMWLYQLGSQIESAHGTWRFALLILVLAAGSNLAQYYFKSPFFGGMSGVNYGLIGYVWWRGKLDPASGLYLDSNNLTMALVWFGLCFTGWVGAVANYAHGGGLLLGVIIGCVSGLASRRKR